MKHRGFVFLVLFLLAASVRAQSGVTVYGLISIGAVHSDNVNGTGLTTVANGPNQTSRLGFKGTEDIGDGDSIFFVLENGFAPDTGSLGQGGRMFGRAAVVGYNSRNYGTFSVGRQTDLETEALCYFEAACQFAGFGTHVGDNDNAFTTFRLNNAMAYRSPVVGGLQLGLQYALSENNERTNNGAYSASLKYSNGALTLGAALLNVDRPASATNASGAVTLDYGFSTPFAVSRTKAAAAVARHRVGGVVGSYKIGDALVSGLFTSVAFKYLDGSSADVRNAELSFSKFVFSTVQAGIGYTWTKAQYDNNFASRSWQQLNVGVLYFLSKRTDLNFMYIHQKAFGAGNVAQIYTQGRSSGRDQNSLALGIRHRF